jgi:hypothetical protein
MNGCSLQKNRRRVAETVTPGIIANWREYVNIYHIFLVYSGQIHQLRSSNGGLPQLRLRFNLDDNNDKGAFYIIIFSGNAAYADRPQ